MKKTPDFDAAAGFLAARGRLLDRRVFERLVRDAVDWLVTIAPAEGGAAFIQPSVSEGPHAPWWVPAEGHPASLIQTGQIAATMYARGLAHPWLDGAARVMWSGIENLAEPNGYEM